MSDKKPRKPRTARPRSEIGTLADFLERCDALLAENAEANR